jgi:hypothetical protein
VRVWQFNMWDCGSGELGGIYNGGEVTGRKRGAPSWPGHSSSSTRPCGEGHLLRRCHGLRRALLFINFLSHSAPFPQLCEVLLTSVFAVDLAV